MPTSRATELVTMKSGGFVSRDALRLLWELEDRQMVIRVEDDRLLVGPTARLTDADDLAIRQHRDELKQLVAVCEVVA